MDVEHPLYCPGVKDWHKWLEQNHAKEPEVWLLRYHKGSATPSVSYSDALDEALAFGWIDGKVKGVDKEKSAIRFSPRKPKSIWSKINKDRAEKLIEAGRMTSSGMAAIQAAKENGNWDNAYATREEWEIPADLEKALAENKEAWEIFHQFSNSHRNPYIYWVNDAKTQATRQKRIAGVITRITAPKKPKPQPGEKWW